MDEPLILVFSLNGKEAAIKREDMRRDVAEDLLIEKLGVTMATYIAKCRHLLDENQKRVKIKTNKGELIIEWATMAEADFLLENELDSLL